MCLYTRDKKVNVAENDITCYKVLRRLPLKIGYYSPCMTMDYTAYVRGKTKDERTVGDSKKKVWRETYELYDDNDATAYKYGHGMLHTFIEKDDAIRWTRWVLMSNRYYIFECVIPKGTKYVRGRDESGLLTYASKRLRIEKRVYS